MLFGREDEYLVNMQHTVIPSWYSRDGYVQSMATLIEKELMKFEKPEEVCTHYKDLVPLNICDIDFRASINKCWQQILFALSDGCPVCCTEFVKHPTGRVGCPKYARVKPSLLFC